MRPLYYSFERRAYSGRDKVDDSGPTSIVFFGHYRCATMMLMRRLSDLIEGKGYKKVDYQGYVHSWPISERELFQRDQEGHERVGRFLPKSRFYSPLRYFVAIPNLPDYKTILVLRDPRDVLVSRFYSEKFAHVRLDERFKAHCEEVEKLELDEFVLKFAQQVGDHYRFYMEHQDALRNALVINYEEVIADFRGFLTRVNEYAELERSPEELQTISDRESFSVDAEDIYSHKRSVSARGFEKKLQESTIAKLNEEFDTVLQHFGWEV